MDIPNHPDHRRSGAARPGLVRARGLLAALLALAMLAGACSSDSDDDTSGEDSESGFFDGDDADTDDAVGDESFFGSEDAEAETASDEMKTEATEEPAVADAEGDFASDASSLPAEETDDGDSDGFLGRSAEEDENRLEDNLFEDHGVRPFIEADEDDLSTFALDVDTGSYTITRRWLTEGVLPDPSSARVEEFVNAFDYDYRAPRNGLSLHVDGAPSPYDNDNVLVRIGVQAAIVDEDDRPQAALTFVIDTSGSMDRDDRLGLVKEALEELVDELDRNDTVAIVTYGSNSSVVLEPTKARNDDEILDAIDRLVPGGSTNMEAGLRTGYELAEEAFIEGGINRVILASDGVANVGLTDAAALTDEIADRAINGIQLVTIGFGMGNFNDTLMEQLADRGDGFYAYVDNRDEAERLFEDELIATLAPVAIDARIQVEFDPDVVDEYRLIGFENRGILDRDFRNDDIDAGELSSGHTVTALYELDLRRGVDRRDDLGKVTLRWMSPDDGQWVEIDEDIELRDLEDDWRDTDPDLRLATLVAVWAELLRGSPYADGLDLDDVADEARRLDDELRTEQSEELADLTDRSAELA